jgi:hypothetical protein
MFRYYTRIFQDGLRKTTKNSISQLMSRDSSVCNVTSYYTGGTTGVQFPKGEVILFLFVTTSTLDGFQSPKRPFCF